MKFCSECFNDTEIKGVIDKIDNEDVCDITGKHSKHIYDTAKHVVLREYFDELLNIYTPISEIVQNIDKEKTVKIKYDLLNNDWDIFSSTCKHSDVYKIIKNICSERYEETPELFNEDVIIREIYDEKYKSQHSLLQNYTWEEFTNSIKCCNRFHSHHLKLDILRKACLASTKKYSKGEIFYRGRISSAEGLPVEEMSAPPIEKTIDGRVNSAGIRCLYLANNINTTINEVRAGIFDYITIGTFELLEDIIVVDFRKINKISPFTFALNGLDLIEYALNKPYLNKINDEMGKSVRKSDSKLDYIPTQYICDFIKSISLDIENLPSKFMGIEYNSTLCNDGYNLAIFEPKSFECKETKIYQVQSLKYNTNEIQ